MLCKAKTSRHHEKIRFESLQQLAVVKFRSKPVGRTLNPGRLKAKVYKCKPSARKRLVLPNSVKKVKTKKYRKLKFHTI